MPANMSVKVGDFEIANDKPFALIAGPCQLETRQHAFDMAGALRDLTRELGIGFVYKTSFDKANRTSLAATRGAGLEAAMPVFDDLRRELGVPILTDIHSEDQCALVAPHVDILQIPAFLCRQTDLLVAAARTGKVVNVKKGQFLAPWDMKNVVAKITESGNGAGRILWLQHAGLGHARTADHGARNGRSGHIRRDPFRAESRRAGRILGRRPHHGSLSVAGGRRNGRCRGVHRDA